MARRRLTGSDDCLASDSALEGVDFALVSDAASVGGVKTSLAPTRALGSLVISLLVACGAACSPGASRSRVIEPTRMYERIDWSPDELRESTAIRNVYRTKEASHHLLRTTVNEELHVHDRSDLVLTVLSGQTRIHFERHFFDLRPGDVVRIPRGVPHWMELVGPGGAEGYLVYTPAFDGKDRRFIGDDGP